MEVKNLDQLQKLNIIENGDHDAELCWFTCLVSCSVTSAESKQTELSAE